MDPPPADLYAGGSATGAVGDRPAGRPDGALATEFTLDLQPPEITDEVRRYAAPSFEPGRPLIDVLRDLNVADQRRLHLPVRLDDGVHPGRVRF